MADWVAVEGEASIVRKWLHVPTGVVLFVRNRSDEYGICIQPTEEGSVDQVSIGDSDTGLFKTFEEREQAVTWADEWKDSDTVRRALEAATPEPDDNS